MTTNSSVEHTGVKKRQREVTLERVVKYDREALEMAYLCVAGIEYQRWRVGPFFFSPLLSFPWKTREIRPFSGRLFFFGPFGRMIQAPAS